MHNKTGWRRISSSLGNYRTSSRSHVFATILSWMHQVPPPIKPKLYNAATTTTTTTVNTTCTALTCLRWVHTNTTTTGATTLARIAAFFVRLTFGETIGGSRLDVKGRTLEGLRFWADIPVKKRWTSSTFFFILKPSANNTLLKA